MARTGRKRMMVEREPNGRPKRPTTLAAIKEAETRKASEEKIVVLSQPHRKGNTSELCESALGRFVQANKCRRELYDAGRAYESLVMRVRRAKGVPVEQRGRHHDGLGLGPSDEAVRGWQKEEERIRTTLCRLDNTAFAYRLIYALAIDERDIPPQYNREAIEGLKLLAVEIGMISAKEQPFA